MNVDEKIKAVLSELSGVENISGNSSLQVDLGLDSLNLVLLMVELEETFAIQFDESDMNPFELDTVDDVTALVRKYSGDVLKKGEVRDE